MAQTHREGQASSGYGRPGATLARPQGADLELLRALAHPVPDAGLRTAADRRYEVGRPLPGRSSARTLVSHKSALRTFRCPWGKGCPQVPRDLYQGLPHPCPCPQAALRTAAPHAPGARALGCRSALVRRLPPTSVLTSRPHCWKGHPGHPCVEARLPLRSAYPSAADARQQSLRGALGQDAPRCAPALVPATMQGTTVGTWPGSRSRPASPVPQLHCRTSPDASPHQRPPWRPALASGSHADAARLLLLLSTRLHVVACTTGR